MSVNVNKYTKKAIFNKLIYELDKYFEKTN